MAATNGTPDSNSVVPKVKRLLAVVASSPTVPMNSPRPSETSSLTRPSSAKAGSVAKPSITTAKYSAGPKLSATCASSGLQTASSTMPRMLATNELTAEIVRAWPARPLSAIA